MIELPRLLHDRNQARRYYECRHCGRTVDGPRTRCPACDTTEIACYAID